MPKGRAFTKLKRKLNGCVTTALLSGSKVPLPYDIVQRLKENNFVPLALCWNGVSGVVDEVLGFMLLSQNRFGMLTHVTFLAFGLSINVPLTLPNSWILALYE